MGNNSTFRRVLVFSNEGFSNSTSNGRTLKNFFVGWPKDKIAQFFIKKDNIDTDVCDNYYNVTDVSALRSIFGKKINGSSPFFDSQSKKENLTGNTPKKRNAFTMLIRDIIWKLSRWNNKDFKQWVNGFNPEVVLLQAGDNGFLFNIARTVAKQRNIPLVIYNSENYYFKDYDYFHSSGIAHFFYPLYKSHFRKEFERTISIAYKSIYICDMLKNDYDKAFHKPSEVIYTSTELSILETNTNSIFTVSYLGNTGVGRHEPLIEIAELIHSISNDYHLDVYGKCLNNDIYRKLSSCEGIRMMGQISYNECVEVMKNSSLLIHAESFNATYREGLKLAFSTKIADTLASGKPFLLYAPIEFACTNSLLTNKAAYVATSKEQLGTILLDFINDSKHINKHLDNALELVRRNHNIKTNREKFKRIINDAVEIKL